MIGLGATTLGRLVSVGVKVGGRRIGWFGSSTNLLLVKVLEGWNISLDLEINCLD